MALCPPGFDGVSLQPGAKFSDVSGLHLDRFPRHALNVGPHAFAQNHLGHTERALVMGDHFADPSFTSVGSPGCHPR